MSDLQHWQIWMSAGIVLLILEVFTPGFLLASFGGGAFLAALIAWFGWGLTSQIAGFALGTGIVFVGMRPFFLSWLRRHESEVAIGKDAMIGKIARVIEAIGEDSSAGRVELGGETWKAYSTIGKPISEGVEVEIERMENLTVWVRPS